MDTKKIRLQAMMTLEEFSKALGLSITSVSKWERGLMRPSLSNQRKIVEFCKERGIEIRR